MKVRLRPFTPEDLAAPVRWSQDDEFCRAIGWTVGLAAEDVTRWWRGLLIPQPDFVRLGIEADGQLVGYSDLADLEQTVGRAEFGIALGERALWGRGLGRAAGQLTLRYGFEQLGLSRVTASVHAPNARSLALMRRLGFLLEGVRRRHDAYRGGVVDVVVFGLLREEFEAGEPPQPPLS